MTGPNKIACRKAIKAVREDNSDEMWRRLSKRFGDKRYVMTLVFDTRVNAKNVSVGDICYEIAAPRLDSAYIRHLPKVSGTMPPDFHPGVDERMWAGRPLYELQIAVCEDAIRQMASLKATEGVHGNDYRAEEPSHTFTAEEKAKFTEALEKLIEELKRTKKAVMAEGRLGIYSSAGRISRPMTPRKFAKRTRRKRADARRTARNGTGAAIGTETAACGVLERGPRRRGKSLPRLRRADRQAIGPPKCATVLHCAPTIRIVAPGMISCYSC